MRDLLAAWVTGDHLHEVRGERDRSLTTAGTAVPDQIARRYPGSQPHIERLRLGRPEACAGICLCGGMILKRHAISVRHWQLVNNRLRP